MADSHFADALIRRCIALDTPLCVGLDPHLSQIPRLFGVQPELPLSAPSIAGVKRFCAGVIEECAERVPCIKPQSAFFERMGYRGWQLLEELCADARSRGILVILDAKRGDIGSTAAAYADACLVPGSPTEADALTVNPYLGMDSLTPFLERAQEHGKGIFVLAKTSNPGGRDIQNQLIDGKALYLKLAERLAPEADKLTGADGWSSLGIVAGATFPAEAAELRSALPRSPFLIPGYGAQGGSASDALRPFVSQNGRRVGGIVNSSRAVLFGQEPRDEAEWRTQLRGRIAAAAQPLTDAMRSDS